MHRELIACRRCPRLLEHCRTIAEVKRRAYREWTYWGKPVPGFGDPRARLLIVGLAPAAHGANRTGRIFTGDRSGDFLYRALHAAGFAAQPTSTSLDDGQALTDCYITASVHCAPPDNKPTLEEFRNCRGWLERELDIMRQAEVVVALGKLAFDIYLSILRDRGIIRSRTPFRFGHNVQHLTAAGQPLLIASYHPSQQNTSTGKLTEQMLFDVFATARCLLDSSSGDS